MTYALIRLGGKQFKVQEGTKITLERQSNPTVDVLMVVEKEKTLVGDPVLKDISVELKKVEDGRARKVRIGRYKSKARYRKVRGHKQPVTTFEVVKIGGKNAKKTEEKAVETKKEVKTETKPVKEAKTTAKRGRPKKVESSETKKAEAPKKRGRPAGKTAKKKE